MKLQEYNFEIEYVKGKNNVVLVVDFLSRIENSPKIKEGNDNESNLELSETIHSTDEELLEHFSIKEKIVNKYKIKIILTRSPKSQL